MVAERHGQTAARNMLCARERFVAQPIIWIEQFDVGLTYVGHAENWHEMEIDGSIEGRDCSMTRRSKREPPPTRRTEMA